MGKMVSIPTKEVETITKSFSADTAITYSPRHLRTVEDCIDQYNKAEEVSRIAQSVIKDRMQGDALLKAKKLICGDEWDKTNTGISKPVFSQWLDFLKNLNLTYIVNNTVQPKVAVRNLLDFAGYKERGGEIETASHYREVKKVVGKDVEDIDRTYKEAGGEDLNTAKEVKEAVSKVSKKIWVQELFEKEAGKCPDSGKNTMALGVLALEKLPSVSEAQWKEFYRKMSRCVHPDHGGTDEDMAILASINNMITTVIAENKKTALAKEWQRDYEQWKKDHGYKDEFIDEEDL